IPLNVQKQNMDQIVLDHFDVQAPKADMSEWIDLEHHVQNLSRTIKIALVGKYVALQDAYISVTEALKHAGYTDDADIDLKKISAEDVTPENVEELLGDADGILVPGGFGDRGIEGKI
ncbi:glutamine amidotransferase-related protein, partial [Clostridioides difficile]|nr:CTP synthase [Clostridioides difficile]